MPDERTRLRREILHSHQNAVKDSTRTRNRIKSFLTCHGIRLRAGIQLTRESGQAYVLGLRDWDNDQCFLLSSMFADLVHAHQQRVNLRSRIAQEVFADQQIADLMKLCGISVISAFTFLATVGDIRRFPNPKKLVAYFGLNPGCRNSGNKERSRGCGMTGCKQARSILVQAAQSIFRSGHQYGGKLRTWGRGLAARKGRS